MIPEPRDSAHLELVFPGIQGESCHSCPACTAFPPYGIQDHHPLPSARPISPRPAVTHATPWYFWLSLATAVTTCTRGVKCSCPEHCKLSLLFLKRGIMVFVTSAIPEWGAERYRWLCCHSSLRLSHLPFSLNPLLSPYVCGGQTVPFPLLWSSLWGNIALNNSAFLCWWISTCDDICRWKTVPKSESWQSLKAELGLKHQ